VLRLESGQRRLRGSDRRGAAVGVERAAVVVKSSEAGGVPAEGAAVRERETAGEGDGVAVGEGKEAAEGHGAGRGGWPARSS